MSRNGVGGSSYCVVCSRFARLLKRLLDDYGFGNRNCADDGLSLGLAILFASATTLPLDLSINAELPT